MQPPRTDRTRLALGALASLTLAACKHHQHHMMGPSDTTPTGAFQGALAAGSVNAVLSLSFGPAMSDVATRAPSFTLVPVASAATVAASSVTGALAITGDGSYPLSGTFDPAATPQLTVSGGGYAITGNYYAANGQLSGSFVAPGGVGGQWTVSTGVVRVFCGTHQETGGTARPLDLTLDSSNRLFGVAATASDADQLQGTYSPGSNPNATVTFRHGGTASGNLDPATGSGSGTYSDNAGHSGTWTMGKC